MESCIDTRWATVSVVLPLTWPCVRFATLHHVAIHDTEHQLRRLALLEELRSVWPGATLASTSVNARIREHCILADPLPILCASIAASGRILLDVERKLLRRAASCCCNAAVHGRAAGGKLSKHCKSACA